MVKMINKSPRSNQGGFILITVLMMISMIAGVVYFTNNITSFSSNQSAEQPDQVSPKNAAYAIQAAMAIETKKLQEDGDCKSYNLDPTGTFNNLEYSVSLSDHKDSPVTLTISVEDNGTLISEVSRDVKMFDNTGDTMETTMNPSEDNFIDNSSPHDASAEELTVKSFEGGQFAILKFSFADFDVPAQYVITSQLEMHMKGEPANGFLFPFDLMIHRVMHDWDENIVSFRDRLSDKAWDQYYFTDGDNHGPTLATTEVDNEVMNWNYWDADELVSEWLDGTYTNFGLILRGEQNHYLPFGFHSMNSSATDKQPILRMTHYCECGSTECDEPDPEEEEPDPDSGCTTVLYPTEDSFIQGSSLNGNSESLKVQNSWGHLSLIKFDLSSLTVPAADIISSKLALHLKGTPESNTGNIHLKRLKLDWDEVSVTYSNRTSSDSWSFYYFPASSNNYGSALDTTAVDGSVIGWEYWDATELVNDWENGVYPNYGLVMYGAAAQNNTLEFHSSNSSDSAKQPYLEITHQCQ